MFLFIISIVAATARLPGVHGCVALLLGCSTCCSPNTPSSGYSYQPAYASSYYSYPYHQPYSYLSPAPQYVQSRSQYAQAAYYPLYSQPQAYAQEPSRVPSQYVPQVKYYHRTNPLTYPQLSKAKYPQNPTYVQPQPVVYPHSQTKISVSSNKNNPDPQTEYLQTSVTSVPYVAPQTKVTDSPYVFPPQTAIVETTTEKTTEDTEENFSASRNNSPYEEILDEKEYIEELEQALASETSKRPILTNEIAYTPKPEINGILEVTYPPVNVEEVTFGRVSEEDYKDAPLSSHKVETLVSSQYIETTTFSPEEGELLREQLTPSISVQGTVAPFTFPPFTFTPATTATVTYAPQMLKINMIFETTPVPNHPPIEQIEYLNAEEQLTPVSIQDEIDQHNVSQAFHNNDQDVLVDGGKGDGSESTDYGRRRKYIHNN